MSTSYDTDRHEEEVQVAAAPNGVTHHTPHPSLPLVAPCPLPCPLAACACSRRDAARKAIADLFGPIIAARRALPDGADKPEDMLQNFIDAEYNDGTKCSDDQIVGMLIGVLFAGQHTSSITSTWVTLNLLHHPEYMKRALAEQVAVFGPDVSKTDNMTMAAVQQLDFLHTCMMESLRQYAPLIMLMRKSHTPVEIPGTGYTVPEGHYLFAPLAVSMNLPDDAPDAVFTNPTRFNPDRFVAPLKEQDKKPFSFCAFGGGKHGCLGEQFGYLQVKTIVSMLLRKFELTPVGPLPKPNYAAMVVGPMQDNDATKVRYRLRTTPLTAEAANAAADALLKRMPAAAAAPSGGVAASAQ